MKKIFSVLLALVLILNCSVMFAETAIKTEIGKLEVKDAFTLMCTMPESYRLEIVEQTYEKICAMLFPEEDMKKPLVTVSIAFNEQYADVERLNDLTEEQILEIENTFSEMDEVKFDFRETGLGTKLLLVTETKDESYVDIYTIYKGFETEFVMVPGIDPETGEIIPMSENAIQMMIDFITGIDFVETAK